MPSFRNSRTVHENLAIVTIRSIRLWSMARETNWRHAETFENRVLVAHRHMHCGLGSQQRSLESQRSIAPTWIPDQSQLANRASHNSSFLL